MSTSSAPTETCQDPVGQHHHSGLHKQTRRYSIRDSDVFCGKNLKLSRKLFVVPLGSSYQRREQPRSRFLKPTHTSARGVVPQSPNLPGHSSSMGASSSGPLCHKGEQTDKDLCFPVSSRSPRHTGCPPGLMEVQAGIRLPSIDSPTTSDSENQRGQGESNPDSTILAQETVVLVATNYVSDRSLGSPLKSQPTLPRPFLPPSSGQLTLDGVELERHLLRSRGFSESLITTLLQSRKQSTTQIYKRIWKKFLQFHTASHTAEVPIVPNLKFLQKGKELGLAVNTLKVQVSALGALYGHNIAGNKWISRFITA
ncbi:uncharacterized protein [Dendrobates tinctorius]|uniref:uncharacterized protein n=1 Tax=Dendrobates tinctorius TaxID=92724 RepID=UPI003CC95895